MCQILPLKAEVKGGYLEHNPQQNKIFRDNFDKNSIDTSSQTKGSYE
ncbi:MAG: hypothetical protein ACLRFH_02195 [Opitutales bacterium]